MSETLSLVHLDAHPGLQAKSGKTNPSLLIPDNIQRMAHTNKTKYIFAVK